MSLQSRSGPIERLHDADPVRADGVPDASLARVSARVQEQIMSDVHLEPTVRPGRGPIRKAWAAALGGAFAFAILVGTGFGSGTPGGGGATPSDNPAAGGGGMAMCLAYDPANLPTFEVVFDGTVTAVDGDQVSFTVNEGWKGAEGSITLTNPDADVALVGGVPDFEVGGRYLVSASDLTINACDYSRDYDVDEASDWAAAFGR